jgi:hypothetical protein
LATNWEITQHKKNNEKLFIIIYQFSFFSSSGNFHVYIRSCLSFWFLNYQKKKWMKKDEINDRFLQIQIFFLPTMQSALYTWTSFFRLSTFFFVVHLFIPRKIGMRLGTSTYQQLKNAMYLYYRWCDYCFFLAYYANVILEQYKIQ